MELEKIGRIVGLFIGAAALALCVARHVMFPDASYNIDIPVAVLLIVAVYRLLRHTRASKENKTE